MFFLNEETTVAETLEVVQEVQQDLEQFLVSSISLL